MSKYPEHDKLQGVQDQSQWLGGLIEWMEGQSLIISKVVKKEIVCPECSDRFDNPDHDGCEECNYTGWVESEKDYGLTPARENINDLLSKYFEIDLVKLENEKRAMLKEIREQS